MADTKKLREAIKNFEFWSRPSSGSDNTAATVGDINKLIRQTATVLRTFVNELEED